MTDFSQAAYRDKTIPINDRLNDLLSRMTLAEKAAQMVCVWNLKKDTLLDENGAIRSQKGCGTLRARTRPWPGRQPGRLSRRHRPARIGRANQCHSTFFIENSRLGIPVFFHDECLHGHVGVGSTSFSQPIGLGATFNPELGRKLFAMTAHEARAAAFTKR